MQYLQRQLQECDKAERNLIELEGALRKNKQHALTPWPIMIEDIGTFVIPGLWMMMDVVTKAREENNRRGKQLQELLSLWESATLKAWKEVHGEIQKKSEQEGAQK